MSKYIRKALRTFEEYIPGEQPQESGWIKLNTNENPYPPSPKVVAALKDASSGLLNLYPDPVFMEPRKTVAKMFQVKTDQIIFGNGSDEVLRLVMEAFLEKGEKVLFPYPSYPVYKTLADIGEGVAVEIPLTKEFDFPEWKTSWQGKVLYIANPNSPTGGLFSPDKIELACQRFKGIVVVDETYSEFASYTFIPMIKKYPNLVVSRTLSKSHSLAGMRIGYAVSNVELIKEMYLIKDSYNLNRLSQVAAVAALKDTVYLRQTVKKILATRRRLIKELEKLKYKVYPSATNFIFACPPDNDGKSCYQYLKSRKILVRFWDKPRLKEGVRITVGTDKEVDVLISALKKTIIR